MAPNPLPSKGEIWIVDLNPTQGRETYGERRALVISEDRLNHGWAGLAMVVPITKTEKNIPSHVRIPNGEGGQTLDGFIKCEEVRSLSHVRFKQRMGVAKAATLRAVMENVAILLGLD